MLPWIWAPHPRAQAAHGDAGITQPGKHSTFPAEKHTKAIATCLSAGSRTHFSLCHQAPSLGPEQGESIPPSRGFGAAQPLSGAVRGQRLISHPQGRQQQPPLPPCSSTALPAPTRLPHGSLGSHSTGAARPGGPLRAGGAVRGAGRRRGARWAALRGR